MGKVSTKIRFSQTFGEKYLSTTVVPFLEGRTRGALAYEGIEGETGIEDAPLTQEDIDLRDGKLHLLGFQAEGLIIATS